MYEYERTPTENIGIEGKGNTLKSKPAKREKIVNIFSDNELRFTVKATHSKNRNFKMDWEKAFDVVVVAKKDCWNVTYIFREMEKAGWKISFPKTVEVIY